MYVIFKWLKDGETWSKEFKERFAEIVTDQELIAITREISRKSRESEMYYSSFGVFLIFIAQQRQYCVASL